jgi:LPS sulfotransferase NodH
MLPDYLISREVSVIHVIRENVLKVYLSRLSARRRQTFHATQAQTEPRLSVPLQDLVSQLEAIERQTTELMSMFKGVVPYLVVTYEGYCAAPASEGRRILEFLEVPSEHLRSPLAKLNPDKLSELVENLHEVRKHLYGTRFAQYVADPPGAG